MKILCAIVTYNRRALLSRCLDSINLQSRKPNNIFVINNSSIDDTENMLQERGVSYITQENSGAAGGWHTAIEYSIENNYDAVWLMDDDGYPDIKALEYLEIALVPEVACVSSVVVCEHNPNLFVFPYPVLNEFKLPVILGWPRKFQSRADLNCASQNGTYPFAHLFNGALLNVSTLMKIGNVEKDFFMFGEELDYLFRMRSVGHVISLLNALHYHPDVSQRPYSLAKIYFYVKNTIILNRRYYDHVWIRSFLTILAVIIRTTNRNGFFFALSLLVGKDSKFFYMAIIRGLKGRIGKDFNA